jgi:hypothetical protein
MWSVTCRLRIGEAEETKVQHFTVQTLAPFQVRLVVTSERVLPGQFEMDIPPEMLATLAGIYEGFRDSQPPSSEELLDSLARHKVAGAKGGRHGEDD